MCLFSCDRLRKGWIGRGLLLAGAVFLWLQAADAEALDTGPPAHTLKLVFVHHSCGENWLADDHGGLGKALAANGYFVSDTNYGWGPDGIGDRTDITDWPDWFTGPESRRYLEALFLESGQHSPFSRPGSDPGGENRVVLFKSCFPNSDLGGRPDDPPRRGHGLTVGNAKAVYNELLRFFASRPDKLFIAVTAPPLQDPANAANARAFNSWLVQEWLAGYPGTNVGVFDFYHVLTGPDNHHRAGPAGVEHVVRSRRNTLYYPTNGDDHPSPAGNRKATRDFVPLLNAYVNRWLAAGPPDSPPAVRNEQTEPKGVADAVEETDGRSASAPLPVGGPVPPGLIDDFERDASSWAAFVDHDKPTRLEFARDEEVAFGGTASLRIAYRVAPESWATCSLVYEGPRDWSAARGLRVHVRARRTGTPVVLVAYQGSSPDALAHFEHRVVCEEDGWKRVDIPWDRFRRPAWEGDPGGRFDPARAMGVALAFEPGEGMLWVDDVSLLSPQD
jgi:hypothetical protein